MTSTGLSHVTFVVSDLDRMEHMLIAVLGAVRVYDSGNGTFSLSEERFFLIGVGEAATWIAIMHGDAPLPRTYNHVAFQVRREDLRGLRETIADLGLDIRPPGRASTARAIRSTSTLRRVASRRGRDAGASSASARSSCQPIPSRAKRTAG